MNLIVVSDSTSLTRSGVKEQNTWPFLLYDLLNISSERKVLEKIVNVSTPGILIADAHRALRSIKSQMCVDGSDVVIIALGIVDSAPQPFTIYLKFLRRLPIIGSRIWGKLKPWLVRNRSVLQGFASIRFTNPRKFKRELFEMINFCKDLGAKILVLQTPNPHSYLNGRSPGLFESVTTYNKIKLDVATETAVSYVALNFPENYYDSPQDGHHFSVEGHEFVAECIYNYLLGKK